MKKIMISFFICFCVITRANAAYMVATGETCAGGAGTVYAGNISGKYCVSPKMQINWWNAYSWCDAQGLEMVDFSDCGCSETTDNCSHPDGSRCPNLSLDNNRWIWMNSTDSATHAYGVRDYYGTPLIEKSSRSRTSANPWTVVMCRM